MRDNANTPISYSYQGNACTNTLSDFELGVGKNGQSDLCNQGKKINELAKSIYKNLNPEFYKKHLGLFERFVLWIYSCTSSSLFNSKLSGIISKYLYNTKDIDINLIKETDEVSFYQISVSTSKRPKSAPLPSSTSKKEKNSLSRSNSCPSIRISPWDNEFSYENYLFNEKLKEKGIIIKSLSESQLLVMQEEIDEKIANLKHQKID